MSGAGREQLGGDSGDGAAKNNSAPFSARKRELQRVIRSKLPISA
ncbi:hypothetical protein [Paenibacillus violae]|nr:hypothetical protein [Paenibacillus sp. PFR10]